jgi:hypothetical protein
VERNLSSVLLSDLADNVVLGADPVRRRVPEVDLDPEADLLDRHHPILDVAETPCAVRLWDVALGVVLRAG